MNITAERLNRGLTVNQAAAAIGIARGTLVALEEGDRIHPANAKKIADFFGCKVTDLPPFASPVELDSAA
jgi:DNA-binding XRE family transcriptional regulator